MWSSRIVMLSRESLIEGYIDAGYTLTPLNGKIPTIKDWVKTEYDPLIQACDFEGNYGVVLRSDDLIVDVDPRRFPKDENVLLKLFADLHFSSKDTFVVKTGGNGLHIYFKKPADIPVRNALKEYPGIEFKSVGQQVVGAGSIHPDTGKAYEVKNNAFQPIQAPETLLNAIKRQEIELAEKQMDFSDEEQNVKRYITYLQTAPAAIEGEGGDITTFKTACRGRDLALSEMKTFELMSEYWNIRCQPEWELEDLKKKVHNAYAYNADKVGKNTAANDFAQFRDMDEDEVGEDVEKLIWDIDKNNAIKPTIRNVVNYLLCKDYPFLGILKYNDFTNDITFVKPAPWHNGKKLGSWTDSDAINFKYWLSRVRFFNVSTPLCQEAAIIAAEKFRYHPVRDYLKSITWDGKSRLDTWLSDFAGVDDNAYTRAVGAKVLIGAVGRVFNPGIKFDTMLVLEGEQGIGKSTLVNILGGEWYGDVSITDSDKDTIDAMRGNWIIEVSEMVCSRKVDTDKLKSFLSKTTDRVRLAYRRNAEDYPRQSIFIGTINPEEGSGYLKDVTGNRRFWPVTCKKVNIEGLKAAREQLLAEACDRYFRGEKLYLDDDIARIAHEETEKRRQQDPWLEPIKDWLAKPDLELGAARTVVTSREILEECIGITVSRTTNRELSRVAHIMVKELGWEKGKFYHKKQAKTTNAFRLPNMSLSALGLE